MATDVTLYVGPVTAYKKFRFTDADVSGRCPFADPRRDEAGQGHDRDRPQGDKLVYVYCPYLMVSWIEAGA